MSATLALSPARPEDALYMGAILSDWIDATPWMPRLYTHAQDRAFCESLVPTTTVITSAEEILGFLTRDDTEISALYIAAKARRQGVASKLVQRAKIEASALTLWTFQANLDAQAFYTHHNFREIDRTTGENAENLPDIQLAWERTP